MQKMEANAKLYQKLFKNAQNPAKYKIIKIMQNDAQKGRKMENKCKKNEENCKIMTKKIPFIITQITVPFTQQNFEHTKTKFVIHSNVYGTINMIFFLF